MPETPMTPEDFQKVANVSRETLAKFETYATLLETWQKNINLIGPGTHGDIWKRHFLDSWQLLPLLEKAGKRPADLTVLDIGAGAGFPGLVLSLAAGARVFLVEPNPKKGAFLRAVIRETGGNAEVLQSKVEDLTPFPVDIVTSRALAKTERILSWGAPFLGLGGEIWLLKGKSLDQELTSVQKKRNMSAEIFPSLTDPEGKIVRLMAKGMAGEPA